MGSMALDYAWLLVVIPLVSGLGLLVWGKEADRFGHLIGVAASAASFVIGAAAFGGLLGRPADARTVDRTLFTWMDAGAFHVDFGYTFDPLSGLFVLLITGVGTLIHVYSIGYMAHDPRRRRFFAYLNIFIAAMLTLVLASDYLVLFLGWEGVGLASYLLIGFWQHKDSAAQAATKAFVINRVGDLGMALAIMVMFAHFGTTSIAGVSAAVAVAPMAIATSLGLLLLVGACGKSAQVPLQAWLLDAMEGPTPVSALIHAATMVTAGVYLVVRSHAVYDVSETARTAVVIVGLVTLLAGAWIGCTKDDIKKALAGSTMSQIGYMMLAAGLGPAGYAFAIFHLLTHGFFKANMFLGAGSVMHGMDDDVNMRHYGAIRTAMPVTFVTFALGYLAIIGVPPFSGFWSKDKIIETAFGQSWWAGFGALIGAGITAFYMTRLMAMTFFGERRWLEGVHAHESPRVMTWPLIALAALSAFGGALAIGGWITTWLAPVVGEAHHPEMPLPPWVISVAVLAVVIVGVTLGFRRYAGPHVAGETPPDAEVSFWTRAGRRELYGNAFNDAVAVRPTRHTVRTLVFLDGSAVDGLVRGLADRLGDSGAALRSLQTGFVRSYALAMVGGALAILVGLFAAAVS